MKKNKRYVIYYSLFVSFLFLSAIALSQNTTSPYSIYGIGDIDAKMYNRTSGMASTGIARQSSVYLINNNPAGIAGLTRSFYLFNVGITGKTVQFTGTPVDANNNNSKDIWIKSIALSVKVNKFWASSFGFHQFSGINYQFNGSKQIEGSTTQYLVGYSGTGGLNDYYWTNAASLGKHFSVGVKSSFIAGSTNQSELITDQSISAVIQSNQQDYYRHLRLEYGAIYNTDVTKKWNFSLGGKFSNKTVLPFDRTLTVTQNGATVVNDQYISSGKTYLPNSAAAGISVAYDKRITYAIDYTFDNWAPLKISGSGWLLDNSNRVSAGVEFLRMGRKLGQVVEKNFLQFGAWYNNGNLIVGKNRINEFGVSMGTGGYVNALQYNISLDVGQRGTKQNNLIRENYFQLTIGLSYRDFLFSKGVKYD